jgi:hypothetical protein
MRIAELKETLKPFALALSRPSIAPEYNHLILSGTLMAAQTASVAIWAKSPVEFDDAIEVEVGDFVGVVSSLPDDGEIELTKGKQRGNQPMMLDWSCKAARASGGIPCLPGREPDPMPALPDKLTPVNETWARMFRLGGCAAGNVALMSVGLDGVVVQPGDDMTICLSSDNASIAGCFVDGPPLAGLGSPVTIAPENADLLATLCSRRQRGRLAFDDEAFIYRDRVLTATVQKHKSLLHDLWAIMKPLVEAEQFIIPLPRKRLAAVVKRASALSLVKNRVAVDLTVADCKLSLRFSDDQSHGDEEYDLAKDVPKDLHFQAKVIGDKLIRALDNCDELVVDPMRHCNMVFRSKACDFHYAVGGSKVD